MLAFCSPHGLCAVRSRPAVRAICVTLPIEACHYSNPSQRRRMLCAIDLLQCNPCLWQHTHFLCSSTLPSGVVRRCSLIMCYHPCGGSSCQCHLAGYRATWKVNMSNSSHSQSDAGWPTFVLRPQRRTWHLASCFPAPIVRGVC